MKDRTKEYLEKQDYISKSERRARAHHEIAHMKQLVDHIILNDTKELDTLEVLKGALSCMEQGFYLRDIAKDRR